MSLNVTETIIGGISAIGVAIITGIFAFISGRAQQSATFQGQLNETLKLILAERQSQHDDCLAEVLKLREALADHSARLLALETDNGNLGNLIQHYESFHRVNRIEVPPLNTPRAPAPPTSKDI